MKKSNKGFAPIAAVLIVAAILVLAGGGYWWWQKFNNWNEYFNKDFGYRLKYPKTWDVTINTNNSGIELSSENAARKCYYIQNLSYPPCDFVSVETDVFDPSYKKYLNLNDLKIAFLEAQKSKSHRFHTYATNGFNIADLKDIDFNGYPAIKIFEESDPTHSTYIYLFNKREIIQVSYLFNSGNPKTINEGSLILNSFKLSK